MGSGIVEVVARAGVAVTVVEADGDAARRGRERLERSLRRAVAAGKLAEQELAPVLGRVEVASSLAALSTCELVVEAVAEDEGLKCSVFAELDRVLASSEAVLASNTSSIPIARLAAATARPERVVGMHFFNPVPVMGLVELVPCLSTSEGTIERADAFARDVLSKRVVRSVDRAGFVVNALLVPYLLAAVRMVESGLASVEDVDAAMRAGCAHPMGPLELADFIGLDTVKSIADVLYAELRDSACVAPALLSRMVESGRLGRKSGRGFYEHGG